MHTTSLFPHFLRLKIFIKGRPEYIILTAILFFAFIVRLAGIRYGLPLWLIDDEPPMILVALKMIEAHSFLPFLHQELFSSFGYYPVILSYFYLPFFFIVAGIKYAWFSGSLDAFKVSIAYDPTIFFLIARLINILLGIASIALMFTVARTLFQSRTVALLSAFFLATSTLHITLSFSARHWLPLSFLFALVFFILTCVKIAPHKKEIVIAAIAGIGMGINASAGIIIILFLFWRALYERTPLGVILKDTFFYIAGSLFAIIALLSYLIYPHGLGIAPDITFSRTKSLSGALWSTIDFLQPLIFSEPILLLFMFCGFCFLWKRSRNFFWFTVAFIVNYCLIFYIWFRFEDRFTLSLFPLFAMLAGYGCDACFRAVRRYTLMRCSVVLLIFIPFIASSLFAIKVSRDDSRANARRWAEAHLTSVSKILVYARLTRLAVTQGALREQESIDAKSVRQIDRASASLPASLRKTAFHALNISTVVNADFYRSIGVYSAQHAYTHLLLDLGRYGNAVHLAQLKTLSERGTLLQFFGSMNPSAFTIASGSSIPLWDIFRVTMFGPPIGIFRI